MKICFCISNLFVPATLTIIKESLDEEVFLYTYDEGIAKFFEGLDLSNLTIFLREELHLGKTPISIFRYLKKRKMILKKIQAYSPREVYFFHHTFGHLENWLIKQLSKSFKIIHVPIFNKVPFKKKYGASSLKGVIQWLLLNRILVEPLWTGERYIHRLSKSFFKKIQAEKRVIKPDKEYIKKVVQKAYNLGRKNIVLLTGTVVELEQVDMEEYTTKVNKLIESIGIENILAKPHPRMPNRYGLENKLDVIPPYIPANVLLTNFEVFIGYSTMALTEAANKGKKAISTLNYLNPTQIERRDNYKEYIIKNLEAYEIYFPQKLFDILELIPKEYLKK